MPKLKCHIKFGSSLLLIIPLLVSAASETELRSRMEIQQQEIKKLEEEITAYQKTLSETQNQSKTLQSEVTRIETQIKKLNTDMRLTQNRIKATELEIEELDGAIVDHENRISAQQKALAQTLQAVYQADADSMMEVLLQHERLSDFFGNLESIQQLELSIHSDLQNLRELKIALEEERNSRTKKHDELSNLNRELQYRRTIEEGAKQSKSTLLSLTKNQESRFQQLLKERETKREVMLAEIQRVEEELRGLIDPSALPETRAGVLGWPLKGSILLTQSYGNTPDSKILYNGKPHNGIDLRASIGTPLYAAESGEVWETGDTDKYPGCLSYGKWILIKHTNNLATLYAHLSHVLAVRGTSVARSDLIGYTGDTGYATGPHLHFTVYDASTVQFRASKIPGSNCQFLPYGGFVNPLAYL
ncbi:MAG: peptidase M23 [Parcubacteria group bacterium Gr01-1014_70]|nr:MAG: peptidase M23 [Parcubacteria group bacterium Gr01-1014_70]